MGITKRALIVIDVQEQYLDKNVYDERLTERINERICQAKEQEELIVYVKNAGKWEGNPYVSELVPGLLVASNHIFEKSKMSAFSNEEFVSLLSEQQVTDVVLAGIDGNCCVAATALDAVKYGLAVEFALSLIGVKSKKQFPKTRKKLAEAGIVVK